MHFDLLFSHLCSLVCRQLCELSRIQLRKNSQPSQLLECSGMSSRDAPSGTVTSISSPTLSHNQRDMTRPRKRSGFKLSLCLWGRRYEAHDRTNSLCADSVTVPAASADAPVAASRSDEPGTELAADLAPDLGKDGL